MNSLEQFKILSRWFLTARKDSRFGFFFKKKGKNNDKSIWVSKSCCLQEEGAIPTLGGVDHENNLIPEALKKILEGGQSESELEQMIETMVQQLMTKDIMYEPMKEACEKVPIFRAQVHLQIEQAVIWLSYWVCLLFVRSMKYPAWLDANRSSPKYTTEQMQQYEKQYVLLKKLLVVYDSTPDDFQQVFALMEEISQCGQPPSDLVQVKFNHDIETLHFLFDWIIFAEFIKMV